MSICSNDGPGWLFRMPPFAVKLPVFDGKATCQCTMTADNDIDYVYLDGKDVTKTISQYNNLGNWPTNKVLTFGCDKYTTMAVQASDGNGGATAGCRGGGFGMKCTASDASSPWHNYESDKSWKVLGSKCKTNPCKYGGSGDDKNTFDNMPQNWFAMDFDDSNWKTADQGNSIATRTGAKMSICSNDGPGWLFRMPPFAVKPQPQELSLPCEPCEKIKQLEEKVKDLLKMENMVDEFKKLEDEVGSLKDLHGEMDEFKQLAGEVEELRHLHGDVKQLQEEVSDIKDQIKDLSQPPPMAGGYYR
jgi:hypothetical protein